MGIFNLSGTLIGTSASLTGAAGTLIGGSRFVSVTPFTLSPGTYAIVAAGWSGGTEVTGNNFLQPGLTSFNSDGGAISLGAEVLYNHNNTFQLPGSVVSQVSEPGFEAGTFEVQSSRVPDTASTAALLFFGMLATGWLRRTIK